MDINKHQNGTINSVIINIFIKKILDNLMCH